MAKLLSGSGGAHCQICTTTFAQAHDIDFVRDGFPINRFIHDAKLFLEEFDEGQLRSLPSDQRFNLTNLPTSDKDIIAASPLHAYLRMITNHCMLHREALAAKTLPTSLNVILL